MAAAMAEHSIDVMRRHPQSMTVNAQRLQNRSAVTSVLDVSTGAAQQCDKMGVGSGAAVSMDRADPGNDGMGQNR